jgi:hypothetical protein
MGTLDTSPNIRVSKFLVKLTLVVRLAYYCVVVYYKIIHLKKPYCILHHCVPVLGRSLMRISVIIKIRQIILRGTKDNKHFSVVKILPLAMDTCKSKLYLSVAH